MKTDKSKKAGSLEPDSNIADLINKEMDDLFLKMDWKTKIQIIIAEFRSMIRAWETYKYLRKTE